MAEPAAPQATKATVLGLIAEHGREHGESIVDFVRLGAAAQGERNRLGVSDVSELTRSTALWTILHLDDEIAGALEKSRITEAELSRVLSLRRAPEPAAVRDVQVHEDLARALDTYLGDASSPITVDLVAMAIAVLRDVQAHGGLLNRRLLDAGADAAGGLADLERRLDGHLEAPDLVKAARSVTQPELPPSITEATGAYLDFYEALRERGKTGASTSSDIDGRALWLAFGRLASVRQDTLATVVALTVLQLRGERASPQDRSVGLRAFDLADDVAAASPEELYSASHPLLRRAGAVRDRVESGEAIHIRHLVAVAIEHGTGPLGPETRDRDVEAVRTAFLDQIRRDAPAEVAARWDAYFAEAHRPQAGVGRAVAGVDVDMVDEATSLSDELHVVDDVVTLCDMLAARGAVPPISVGLFGRWGSGKSYFMALMRRRIDELRNAALAAKEHHEETSYCSEVVQVTFNAWHYMDADDLWATMAVHLFSAIAQVDPDDDRARPRADVVRELQASERRVERLDERITRVLGDRRFDEAAERMGLTTTREDVLGLLSEVDTTIGYAAAGKVLLTRGRRW